MPGFEGEIIMEETLAEPDNVRGWVDFAEINGDIDGENHNIKSLIELFQRKGHGNVTSANALNKLTYPPHPSPSREEGMVGGEMAMPLGFEKACKEINCRFISVATWPVG